VDPRWDSARAEECDEVVDPLERRRNGRQLLAAEQLLAQQLLSCVHLPSTTAARVINGCARVHASTDTCAARILALLASPTDQLALLRTPTSQLRTHTCSMRSAS
jgi:hypothetical protein